GRAALRAAGHARAGEQDRRRAGVPERTARRHDGVGVGGGRRAGDLRAGAGARRGDGDLTGPTTMADTLKIMIVDDHYLVRVGLTSIIGLEQDMTICAEASSG